LNVKYGFDLADTAENIVKHLRANGFTVETQPDRQALALAEEVGEFIQEWRRWRGQARQQGTVAAVTSELADVVITAYVTAAEQGWDLNDAIESKLNSIFTRGWRA
jgi:NTP pyrophosphatase (non-canonical NTP hydrolase)